MANFDTLISGLHSGRAGKLSDDRGVNDSNIIIVNDKRQFSPGPGFNTIIAYEGDINSQVITFKLPRYHDGHDLSNCDIKIIKWRNSASGQENTSNLVATEAALEDAFYVAWTVAPEMCTRAGKIEISISIYDKSNDRIAFSWNTSSYSGLSIGASSACIGHTFPNKTEILTVNKETKNIIAPAGYNNVICTLGDVGTTHVYFLVNRYLGADDSFDIFGDGVVPAIYIIANGYRRKDNKFVTLKQYTVELEGEDRNKEGLVFIDWAVPAEITGGSLNANSLEIALEFSHSSGTNDDGEVIIDKRWISNPYKDLKINPSILQSIVTPGGGTTDEYVYKIIDDYFEVHEITWEAE